MADLFTIAFIVPIALMLFAVLGSVAITSVFGIDQSTWDLGTTTMWNLLPMISIIGIILAFLAVVGLKIDKIS